MKNKIILMLILLIASSQYAFAIQDAKVISDGKKQKELMDAFNEVNQYSDHFFMPHVIKKVKEVDEDEENKENKTFKKGDTTSNQHGSVPPVKQFRLWVKSYQENKNKPKTLTLQTEPEQKDQALLDCETMEYFAERTELEANGNVVMFFPENNSTLKADKVVYNQTSNLIKAYGHVVLIHDGQELFGDFMNIDMNEENAVMDNPATDAFQIRARAKKGYMYGDKIIQEQGSLYVKKHAMVNLKAEMFGPDLDTMYLDDKDRSYFMKESHGEKFKIKTNDLIINSKKEHDTLTLKHAEIYFGGKKVGTIPSITMHTNKKQDYAEADFPELGTMTNLGAFVGPGFVFDTPRGTTLKVVPMLNYQSNGGTDNSNTGGSDNKLGWGSIVKFKSATNKTDMAYGTTNGVFLMAGMQRLDDKLYLQYGMNRFMDDGFMGFRMAKVLGELVYNNDFYKKDFFARNKDLVYSHRIAAGYAQDGAGKSPLLDGDGFVGTTRFKYMAQLSETLYKFNTDFKSPINARLDLVEAGSAALYGTGDTQMVARIGPMLHTQYKSWMQDVGYFLSAYDDKTPMRGYDAYMYGRSNVYMRESFRICKYLTASWFGSLNLSQDSWDGNMIQENGFYFGIGPDDVKLNIGYDTVRQQSFVSMSMHLDAKGTTVEYKKMVIKNPDTLGKSKNGDNKPTSGEKSLTDEDGNIIEKAEVINLNEAL